MHRPASADNFHGNRLIVLISLKALGDVKLLVTLGKPGLIPQTPSQTRKPTGNQLVFPFPVWPGRLRLLANMVGVAQLVEHPVVVRDVAGSSPVAHPTKLD